MKKMVKFLFAAALAAMVAVLLITVWPVPLAASQLLVRVPPGASLTTTAHILADSGVQLPAPIISGVGRLAGLSGEIKAGSYEFDEGITLWAMLKKMSKGDTSQTEVLLVEGISFREMRQRLNAQSELLHITQDMTDADMMIRLGLPRQSPEGWFFPDTYRFDKHSEDIDVLRRALSTMQHQVARVWQGREANLPLQSPYELLILASLVEKETGTPGDRSQIAGVFINRLRLGMRLQTDPAVIYGLGTRFDGNLRKADLQQDTPHNTYTRSGLPPTPICMPGLAALQAAAHPAATRSLYFVARGDGSSQFSETLAAHNQAVNQYQRGHSQ